jgi:hypothetical protein
VPQGTQDRRSLVALGATAFALTYLASTAAATTGYTADDGSDSSRAVLWIPAVGPFIALGDHYDAVASLFLVLDGLAQVGGLSLFVYGLAAPAPAATGATPAARISLMPTYVRGGPGAAFVATF